MPVAPSRPCRNAICGNLQPCPRHSTKPFATAQRSSSAYRLSRWQTLRREHLRLEPYCRACAAQGQRIQAKVVDHIIPHRGDAALFWAPGNLQSLCRRHGNAKTAVESAERRRGA